MGDNEVLSDILDSLRTQELRITDVDLATVGRASVGKLDRIKILVEKLVASKKVHILETSIQIFW